MPVVADVKHLMNFDNQRGNHSQDGHIAALVSWVS